MATVTVGKLLRFSAKEDEVFRKAGQLLQKAINDASFEKMVISAQYTHLSFKPANGAAVIQKTPQDIVDIIRSGRERGTPSDNDLDISIEKDDNRQRPSVGGSFPGILPWKTAKWFIEQSAGGEKPDTISPARHMVHEWLHVAGFVHQGKKGDPPYVVGAIVRQILKSSAFVEESYEDPELAKALDDCFED